MTEDAYWVGLLSGGKDSSWAIYRAIETGLPVEHLLTARPTTDSYMFHVPAVRLTPLIADAMGLSHTTFDLGAPSSTDAGTEGDLELEALRYALLDLDEMKPGALQGVVSGAVASRFQYDRLDRLCRDLDLEQFAPLWACDPEPTLREMIDAGFDIRIVGVGAAGLDDTWLGRQIDAQALDDLLSLHEEYGIHVMGEGGEYETIVVAGPHMDGRIEYDAVPEWDGSRGHLRIKDAYLAD